VYLAYLDESETHKKPERWLVVCAAMVSDATFSLAELMSSFAIENLCPEEKRKDFEEFHACELYGGYGPFEGIEQFKRFEAIEFLLGLLASCEVQVTYGAVDLDHLRQQAYASANPLDFAFRMCLSELGGWSNRKVLKSIQDRSIAPEPGSNLALLIVDECDKADKIILQNSFRSMRKRLRPPDFDYGQLTFLHDDMYFGDSRYSIGIQIADLCAYFIARHLSGDEETERFYKMIEPQIFSSKK
jgi:Protein of unknown function (DUF3800)